MGGNNIEKIQRDLNLVVGSSAVRKVWEQTPKHTKYAKFQDAPTLVEYLIALSEIFKISCYLEFNILSRWRVQIILSLVGTS